MTLDLAPFSPPGTAEYARAGASFQLAVPVDPAGLFAGDVGATRDRV